MIFGLLVFQGIRPIVNVDSCYISDMYSFCTVLEPEEKSSAILTIANSVIYDVQVTCSVFEICWSSAGSERRIRSADL